MYTLSNTKKRPRNAVVLGRADSHLTFEQVDAYAWEQDAAYMSTVPNPRTRYAVQVMYQGDIRIVDANELRSILTTLATQAK